MRLEDLDPTTRPPGGTSCTDALSPMGQSLKEIRRQFTEDRDMPLTREEPDSETAKCRAPEPVSSSSTSGIGIEHLFELRDRIQVDEFLKEHPDLVDVLVDAAAWIRNVDSFPMAKLALEFFVDPEDDSETTAALGRLVIVIGTELSAEEAFDRYKHLQASWWLNVFARHGDRLSLDVEFV